jgi:hypothetical protein
MQDVRVAGYLAALLALAAVVAGCSTASAKAPVADAVTESAPVTPAPASGIVRCGPGGLEIRGGTLAGGYTCAAEPYDSDVQSAARALISSIDHMLPSGSAQRDKYQIESAAAQVVAGMNYQLVIRVNGAHPETVIGTVYRPLTGDMSVTDVYALAR